MISVVNFQGHLNEGKGHFLKVTIFSKYKVVENIINYLLYMHLISLIT